jgi:hypothetical protein
VGITRDLRRHAPPTGLVVTVARKKRVFVEQIRVFIVGGSPHVLHGRHPWLMNRNHFYQGVIGAAVLAGGLPHGSRDCWRAGDGRCHEMRHLEGEEVLVNCGAQRPQRVRIICLQVRVSP